MNDSESKDAMLRIAQDYERLAERVERRGAGRAPSWMKHYGQRGHMDTIEIILGRITSSTLTRDGSDSTTMPAAPVPPSGDSAEH
jgi:hypothetical protein